MVPLTAGACSPRRMSSRRIRAKPQGRIPARMTAAAQRRGDTAPEPGPDATAGRPTGSLGEAALGCVRIGSEPIWPTARARLRSSGQETVDRSGPPTGVPSSERPICGRTVAAMSWMIGCTAVSERIPVLGLSVGPQGRRVASRALPSRRRRRSTLAEAVARRLVGCAPDGLVFCGPGGGNSSLARGVRSRLSIDNTTAGLPPDRCSRWPHRTRLAWPARPAAHVRHVAGGRHPRAGRRADGPPRRPGPGPRGWRSARATGT